MRIKSKVWWVILFLFGLVLFRFVIAPLKKVEEHTYVVGGEAWNGGEIRVYFSPSFTMLRKSGWPQVEQKGSPYGLGVAWITDTEKGDLTVSRILIESDGQQPFILPSASTIGASKNTDGRFYCMISHNNVSLTAETPKITLECSMNSESGPIKKTFQFKAIRNNRTYWINTIVEALMGV